jgi:hypothetical protein
MRTKMVLDTVYFDKFIGIDEKSEKSITSTILDIESLFNHNFHHGLLYLDEIILQKCKRKLIAAFHANGYYNLSIECDMIQLKNNNALTGISDVPRVYIQFTPQELKSKDFLVEGAEPIQETVEQKKIIDKQSESIFKENEAIRDVVNSLNSAISSSKRHDIINVRMNNLTDQDGYVVYINLNNTSNLGDVLNKILSFKNDVSSLNMDELIIAQQFTSEFYVEQKNPYWLNTMLQGSQGISNKKNEFLFSNSILAISLYNPHYQVPTYSLQIIIDLILAILHKNIDQFVDENDEDSIQVNHLIFKKSYKNEKDIQISCDSISGSYFFINLKAML